MSEEDPDVITVSPNSSPRAGEDSGPGAAEQASSSKPSAKRSAIWEHFEVCESDSKYAVCKYCDKKVSPHYFYQFWPGQSFPADLVQHFWSNHAKKIDMT